MRILILIILVFLSDKISAQIRENNDSLIIAMCETLVVTKELHDTLRVQAAYEKHLFGYFSHFPEEEHYTMWENIFIRWQRNCPEFMALLLRLEPQKGDWEIVSELPESKMNNKECRNFMSHDEYLYLEYTGDTVRFTIKNNFWMDHFEDGTYSKLNFRWLNDCEFEIEFIESNNITRMNLSKPGEKYRYRILDRTDEYYNMGVHFVGTENNFLFKIYY